jgi:uncharacterized membrane protein
MDIRTSLPSAAHVRKNILAGLIAVAPLLVTWVVFKFIFTQVIRFGTPGTSALYWAVYRFSPDLAEWLFSWWVESAIAVLVTFLTLYLLGAALSRMVGRQVFQGLEMLLARVPILKGIYSSTKRLLLAFQVKPEQIERVVLIRFPYAEIKTVGFVTRVIRDADTGEELAVVYVPTAPNPTSGYLEIVPLRQVTPTDWTVEEGMQFVISCGTSAPDTVKYHGGFPEPSAKGRWFR